jgi:hypothetical protein
VSALLESEVHWERHTRFPSLEAPWIAAEPDGAFVGFLFYYAALFGPEQRRAVLYAGGTTPSGNATKILWGATGDGAGDELLLRGSRHGGSGFFESVLPARRSGDPGDETRWFPGDVVVPAPGCWDVLLRSGSVVGKATFSVEDASSTTAQ